MTRKKLPLAIAALTAGMFGSGVVYAMGLGDIKLYSHLNEPLQAEIELVEIGDLNADEVVAKMASKEAFDKEGIDRDYFLTQIKFDVVIKPDGRAILKLSTDKPTREPFLDFILEASWPTGRMLKQYTLLLDPPTYSADGAPPTVSKPEPEVTAAPVAATQPSAETAAAPEAAAQAPAAAPAKPVIPAGTELYTTKKDDTLWHIASTHQVAGASVYQIMDAIHKINPDAFIKSDRNLLKTEKSLRLPSPEEVAYLSQGGSVDQMLADQLQASQPQLSTEQAAASTATTSEDKLKIVGSGQGTATGTATSAGTSESIDKIDRDNQDMNARLVELTSQIKTMQQLIQLQDDQLTALQQKLGASATTEEKRQAVQKLKDELSKVESEINKETTPAPSAATNPATAATPAPTAATTPAAVGTTPAAVQPTAAVTATTPPPAASKPTPVTSKPAEKPKPVKAVEPAPVEEESNSMLVILAGVLLGVLAAVAVFAKKFKDKRKAQQQGESEADWSAQALEDEPSLASMIEEDAPVSESEKIEEPLQEQVAPAETAQPEYEKAPAAAQQQAQSTVDPLTEANHLVDQNNVAEAITVLKDAIAQNTTRLDLRTRLLELSVDVRDLATFEAQEAYISRWGGAAAKQRAKELRAIINTIPTQTPVEAAPAMPAVDTTLDFNIDTTTPVEAPAIEKTPEDELVSLDHLFDDAPAEPQPEVKTETAGGSDDLAALDHLFDETPAESKPAEKTESITDDLASLDHLFDATPTTTAPVEEKQSDEIEFDLSAFAEPEAAVETKVEEPAASDIELSADFDLPVETTPAAAEPEFDLSAELEIPEETVQEAPSAEVISTPAQEEAPATPAPAAGEDDEFGFLAGADADEAATKLDLAKAYIDMEDMEGAKDILQEVLQEGNEAQQQEAKDLLAKL